MGGDSNVAARGACSHAVVQSLFHIPATCIGRVSRRYANAYALGSML
jgi:hypothetical protein